MGVRHLNCNIVCIDAGVTVLNVPNGTSYVVRACVSSPKLAVLDSTIVLDISRLVLRGIVPYFNLRADYQKSP